MNPGRTPLIADAPPGPMPQQSAPRSPSEPGPTLEFGQAPIGRETLAAITDELLAPDIQVSLELPHEEPRYGEPRPVESPAPRDIAESVRPRRRTLGFSSRPPSADAEPNALRPKPEESRTPEERRGPGAPESRGAPEQALAQQLDHWARTGDVRPSARPCAGDAWEVFEMATFVVRGDLARLASVAARRDFVAERLLHRLPVRSIQDVDRIDITPWTVHGTVIVRVWCRV